MAGEAVEQLFFKQKFMEFTEFALFFGTFVW